jgi:hypothetical protein
VLPSSVNSTEMLLTIPAFFLLLLVSCMASISTLKVGVGDMFFRNVSLSPSYMAL